MHIHDNTQLILGPPGTGKTTYLLNTLTKILKSGVAPENVGFVSFTRKAAYEARDRAAQVCNLDADRFPWFRTLHSLAFRCLGLGRDDVMKGEDWKAIGDTIGEHLSAYDLTVDEGLPQDFGGRGGSMVFTEHLSRCKCEDMRKTWHELGDERVSWVQLQHYRNVLLQYKAEHDLYDFTDMIQKYVAGECSFRPPLEVLFVDEAQDLTQLQWRMVRRLAETAKQVYIAGDDDQAIYTWSGADVATFLMLDVAGRKTLDVSYRLPSAIHDYANTLSGRISNRYGKEWRPRKGDPGLVEPVYDLDEVPFESEQWLVLVRNRMFMKEMVEYFRMHGLPYSAPGDRPLESGVLDAIRLWEQLRAGKQIQGSQAREVFKWLRVGTGFARGQKHLPMLKDDDKTTLQELKKNHGLRTDAIWHEAMELIPVEDKAFLIAMLKKGENLRKARIVMSTIHSIKGGEQDNVLLMADMAGMSYRCYEQEPDSEHRVFYVGATRAKQRLYLLEPRRYTHYPLTEYTGCMF